MIIGAIINLVLVVMGVAGMLWMGVGFWVGMVWMVITLAKNKKMNWKKWVIVTWGGFVLTIGAFFLFALKTMIFIMLGLPLIGSF